MYITYELLKEKGACSDGSNWFKQNFPEGCELNEETIARVEKCDTSFVWWFYNNIQQDKRLYKLCGVNGSDGVSWSYGVSRSYGVNRSDGVSGSHGVNRSDGVSGSDGVNRSDGVNGSDGVNRSYGVNRSHGVSGSDGVNRSDGVNESHGVNRSDGVNGSDGVSWSYGVNGSHGVSWSHGVNRSDGVSGSDGVNRSDGVNGSDGVSWSFGILNSYGVDRALFLANKKRVYLIFGKEVSEGRFLEVENNLYRKLGSWRPTFNNIKALYLKNGSDWKLTPIKNAEEISKQEAWKDMPREAVEYIASLSEFDADMFFEITCIDLR